VGKSWFYSLKKRNSQCFRVLERFSEAGPPRLRLPRRISAFIIAISNMIGSTREREFTCAENTHMTRAEFFVRTLVVGFAMRALGAGTKHRVE
jgi:hypothetical protein